jgi:mitotic spindle assembly checkpoint protein MAD2B
MEFEFIESAEELLSEFCTFLEISIHLILFNRQLYPRELFEKKIEFGLSVQYCNHPSVVNFVKSAIESIKPLLKLNVLEKIFIAIFSKDHVPLEQFILSFNWFLEFSLIKDPICIPRYDIENIFRDFFFKIIASDKLLDPLPCDTTFDLVVRTCKKIKLDKSMNFTNYETPWKIVETNNFNGSTITPLKDQTTNLFRIQLLVEEKDKSISEKIN